MEGIFSSHYALLCAIVLFNMQDINSCLLSYSKIVEYVAYVTVSGGTKGMPVLPPTRGKSGMIFMPHMVGQEWPFGCLRPKLDCDEEFVSSCNLSKFMDAPMIYLHYKTNFI